MALHDPQSIRPFPATDISAIIFDYGNTLIEFGPRQVAIQYEALLQCLTRMFNHCDQDELKRIRDKQIMAPYNNHYI